MPGTPEVKKMAVSVTTGSFVTMGLSKAENDTYFNAQFSDLSDAGIIQVPDANYYLAKMFTFSIAKLLGSAFLDKWYRHIATGLLGAGMFGIIYYWERPESPNPRYFAYTIQKAVATTANMAVGSYVGDKAGGKFVSMSASASK